MEQLTPTQFRSEYILLSRDFLKTDLIENPLAFVFLVEIAATAWPGPTTKDGLKPGEMAVACPQAINVDDFWDALNWLVERDYLDWRRQGESTIVRLTLKGELYISPGIDRGTAPTGTA